VNLPSLGFWFFAVLTADDAVSELTSKFQNAPALSNGGDNAVSGVGQTGSVPVDTGNDRAPSVQAGASDNQAAVGIHDMDVIRPLLSARDAMLQGIIESGTSWARGDCVTLIDDVDPYGQNIEVDSVGALDKDYKS
jgi:hypothetical protein